MEAFSEYGHAIASLVIFTLIVLVFSPFTALAKQAKGLAPGATPEQDYSDSAYRMNRAYLNCVETLPAFVVVTMAAILAGASPFWVNLLASLALLARMALLFIHVKGIGNPNMGPRTFAYVGGWACMILLGLIALVNLF